MFDIINIDCVHKMCADLNNKNAQILLVVAERHVFSPNDNLY